jgi:hypothetical protein
VFIPHEIFERKPLLGLLLGITGFTLSLVLFAMVAREYRGFGKSPEETDLKTITPPPETLGKWVRVTQPLKVFCEPIEVENQLEHQLLFGRVESTYFLAEIAGSPRFVVLQRHKKASCDDVRRAPFVGVLTEINPRLHSTLEGRGMVFPRDKLAMLLCLSCGPEDSRQYLFIFPVIMAASLWLMSRSWRRYLRLTAFREGSSLGS